MSLTSTLLLIAVSMFAAGGAILNFQRSGRRSFETFLIFAGLALMVCGLAMAQDVMAGSTKILWVLRGATPLVSTASSI